MMHGPHYWQIKFILVYLASGTKLTKTKVTQKNIFTSAEWFTGYTEAHFYIFTVEKVVLNWNQINKKKQSYTEAHFYIFTVDVFVISDRTVDELVLVPLQWIKLHVFVWHFSKIITLCIYLYFLKMVWNFKFAPGYKNILWTLWVCKKTL